MNLESSDGSSGRYRYLVVVVTKDTKHVDEAAILGIDIIEATTSSGSTSGGATCTIGLVLPVFSDTSITLDGDGLASRSYSLLYVIMRLLYLSHHILLLQYS